METLQKYISENSTVGTTFRVVLVLVVLYAIYRYIMSNHGYWLRQKLPPLRYIHASREVKDMLKNGEYSKAGDKLLGMGEEERAAEIFQEGKLYSRAGDIYANQKNFPKAILMYEKAGDFKKVGKIYLKQRGFDKLEELYGRNGKLNELGQLYHDNKKYERAAQVFGKATEYFQAAENYLLAGQQVKTADMLEKYFYQSWKSESPDLSSDPSRKVVDIALKAGMLFEKNNQWDRAVDIYKKVQDKKRIANVLSRKGDFKGAASLAAESGDFKLASELHRKTSNDKESVRMEGEYLFQQGELLNAVEKFKEAGDFARCADIYADLQEYIKAAEMHEQAGDHYLAAKIFMDEKNFLRAGENYEKAKYFDDAIVAYREGKYEHKLLELLDKTGQYFEIAEYFLSRKLPEQAVAAAEKMAMSDPNYRFGAFIRGKIYYDQGDYKNAQKLLEESLSYAEDLESRDLNTLHYLALTEQSQNAEKFKSLEILETKLAENQVEKTAMDKAMKIRQMIQEKSISRVSQTSMATMSPSGMKVITGRRGKELKEKRYTPIKEIGRGGMGVVYLAKDEVLGREVALKILPTSIKGNDRIIQTFLREAKSAAALNHPGIVTVFDTGNQEGEYYIAMEYIDGQTIKKILKKKGKFSHTIVVELLKQLLSALEYAHSKNVIHRDLTTSNIMWTKQKLVKIMDFGLAKTIHSLQSEQSIIGGTPSFMSPEQTVGHPADHRTDIYSLGICIFEMCMGTLPFSKGDLGYHHLHTPPPIPKEIDPTIPQVFNDIILKCMQKKPEDRFQSVREIAQALSFD